MDAKMLVHLAGVPPNSRERLKPAETVIAMKIMKYKTTTVILPPDVAFHPIL
jgi:hypothetical protein